MSSFDCQYRLLAVCLFIIVHPTLRSAQCKCISGILYIIDESIVSQFLICFFIVFCFLHCTFCCVHLLYFIADSQMQIKNNVIHELANSRK